MTRRGLVQRTEGSFGEYRYSLPNAYEGRTYGDRG